MLLKIFLIILGLPILILPLTTKIINNKKLTIGGIFFVIFLALFTLCQFLNEQENSRNEILLENNKVELSKRVDSLYIKTLNLSDSLINLKNILLAIDSQFYYTSNKLFDLRQINDSLNLQLFESDRPIFHLVSTEIHRSKIYNNKYTIDFHFGNEGIRAVTNVFGKMYILFNDTLYYNGTLPISKSDIFPSNKGFTYHSPMKNDPDSTSLEKPIYYYFKLTYSDIILKKSYPYEVVMKLNPFTKGNCLEKLVLCKNWEEKKIKMIIEK